MNDKEGSPLSLAIPGFALILALVGAAVWRTQPLVSSRPDAEAQTAMGIAGPPKTAARLWQDPLGALASANAANKPIGAIELSKLKDSIPPESPGAELGKKVMIAFAIVPSETYAEDTEMRLRSRYALVSALSVGGYRASDEAHIAAVKLPIPQRLEPDDGTSSEDGARETSRAVRESGDASRQILQAGVTLNVSSLESGRTAPKSTPESTGVVLPYEWFQKRVFDHRPLLKSQDEYAPLSGTEESNESGYGKVGRVLVLWVPDYLFAGEKTTMENIEHLVTSLKGCFPAKEFPSPDVCIFGPLGSTMLRDILPNVRNRGSESETTVPDSTTLRGVRMYSYSATAMDELLAPKLADRSSERYESTVGDSPGLMQTSEERRRTRAAVSQRSAIKAELRKRTGLDFYNTITTDDELSMEVIDELKLRNVDLTDSSQHAVLISEWDTFYGRNLPVAFDISLRKRIDKEASGVKRPEESRDAKELLDSFSESKRSGGAWAGLSLNSNLHSYTYLRGLDGKTVGEKRGDKESEGPRVRSEMKDLVRLNERAMNRAEGENQLDYVPRLGDQLERLRDHLKGEGGELKAIGVVGSDFYDKLLILQGLRDRFPSAIFFTTDLDARFLQPEFLKWTRNLVVVSGFGLSLHPEWQRDVSPFRGSYQTSLFFASLCALKVFPDLPVEAPPPRCFEIGRFRAVDLSVQPSGRIHPPSVRLAPSSRAWWLVMATFVCSAFLVLFAFPWMRDRFLPSKRLRALEQSILAQPDDISPICDENGASVELSDEQRKERADAINDEIRLVTNSLVGNPNWEPAGPKAIMSPQRFTGWSIGFWSQKGRRRLAALTTARDNHDRAHPGSARSVEARTSFRANELRMQILETMGIVAGLSLFVYCALKSHIDFGGEPIALWEGISIWPSECFRLAGLALSLFFIGRTVHALGRARLNICAEFGFDDAPTDSKGKSAAEEVVDTTNGIELWDHYQRSSKASRRLGRVALFTLVYYVGGTCFFLFMDQAPFVPARGAWAIYTDKVVLYASVLASIFLTFLVVDATRLCRGLVRDLESPTKWPLPCLRRFALKNLGANHEDLGPWIDVQLVARLTAVVSQLVYYPFIVLGVLIIARSRYFDAWDWPLALIVILSVNALWAFSSLFLLRNSAQRARDASVAALRKARAKARIDGEKGIRISLLEEMISDAEKLQEGALSPPLSNPALKAILFPLTGGGLALLLEFLTSR